MRIKRTIKKKVVYRIALRALAVLVLVTMLSGGMFFLLIYAGAFGALPGRAELESIKSEDASLVYSSDGVLIGKYFAQNRTSIGLDDIPGHLKDALIATEDRRFYSHRGYDTRSYFRVFLKTLLLGDESGGGGSTITQQLVKNLFGRKDFGIFSIPVNKLKEIIIASRIEKVYTKEEILLLYLNSVPFGEDVYGAESAAGRYFNKPLRELRIEESAVLAGMLKANTYYNPRLNPDNSLERRNMVFHLMANTGYISDHESDSLSSLPLILNYRNLNLDTPAGYFVYAVKEKAEEILDSINTSTNSSYQLEKDGLLIYTTLNMQLQDYGNRAVQKHMSAMQRLLDNELERSNYRERWLRENKHKFQAADTSRKETMIFDWNGISRKNISSIDSIWHYHKMLNSSVLITNPNDGSVLTWIGGNNYRLLPFDMVLSHRQVASAFKPVVYASALEAGFSPCTYLENIEKSYPDFDDWRPQNADKRSTPDSTVAFWYALTRSMNLPTVDLLFDLGYTELENTCRRLNLPVPLEETPSLALGTLDLSLYELVRTYSAFACEGKLTEPYLVRQIVDSEGNILYERQKQEQAEIFSQDVAREITAILQQVVEQGTTTSLRSRYGIKSELAAKTGTASDYSNAWFIAYTPDLVIGSWAGARMPEVHFNSASGSGSALALPVVADILGNIEKNRELSQGYLTPFNYPPETYSFLDCEPWHRSGIGGFLDRIFRGEKEHIKDSLSIKKEKKDLRSLIKDIFGKKK